MANQVCCVCGFIYERSVLERHEHYEISASSGPGGIAPLSQMPKAPEAPRWVCMTCSLDPVLDENHLTDSVSFV